MATDLIPDRVLCLSNGHGEDAIAVRILEALQQQPNAPELAALPIVGSGFAYRRLNIPLIGSVKVMPSGGFIHMDSRQLARDVQGGLLQLTLAQLNAIRQWAIAPSATALPLKTQRSKLTQNSLILAVGDIVPLLMAYLSGLPYAFVGTAKSEYYVRNEAGELARSSWWDDRLERWTGSIYHPWERWLMRRSRCKAVFPRDRLTTERLQQQGIPAFDLGNPMMDGLQPRSGLTADTLAADTLTADTLTADTLAIVLLPGSRPPEAYENWRIILQAVESVITTHDRPLLFLGAIALGLELNGFRSALTAHGWQSSTVDPHCFHRDRAVLRLSLTAFGEFLHRADAAIALAGTANEQFVGLGKPAVIIPGKGPQFTPAFAEAQTRLLGCSVTLVTDPAQVGETLRSLLRNPTQQKQIAENGRRRLGEPGAADRIAKCLMQPPL